MKHYNSIDFLRVVFSVFVIIGHTNRIFFPNAAKDFSLQNMSVDVFFIISGFFLASSIFTRKSILTEDNLYIEITIRRLKRLYPMFLFSFIFGILLLSITDSNFLNSFYKSLWTNLFLLGGLGEIPRVGSSWYVAALFWAGLIVSALLIYNRNSVIFWNPLIISTLLIYIYSKWGGLCLISKPLVDGWLSGGFMKALCDLLIGVEIFYFSGKFDAIISKLRNKRFLICVTEIICTIGIAHCLSRGGIRKTDFLILFFIPLLMLIFVTKNEILYRFSESNVWAFLGKYTYAVYLMHAFLLSILKDAFQWQNNWKTYTFCSFVCFLFGVASYYIQILSFRIAKKMLIRD